MASGADSDRADKEIPMWREPLIHFLLLGGLFLVGWEAFFAPPPPRRIVVDAGTVDALTRRFGEERGRPPTDEERAALVEGYVEEEVLYREALALGFDRTDPIVRRRLIQKMRFVLEGLAETGVSGDAAGGDAGGADEAVADWYRAHREDYRAPDRVTFEQIFFARDRRGDATERRDAALAAVRDGADGEPPPPGDPFVHGRRFEDVSSERVRRLFGETFAEGLGKAPVDAWAPLSSELGEHLVRLTGRAPGTPPPLAAIRDRVEADWRAAERERVGVEALRDLRKRYEVEVRRPEETPGSPPATSPGPGTEEPAS